VGEENRDIDDTKVEIICFPTENGSLEIHFKPQSAGVVKITYQGPKKPNKDNSLLDKEIANLKNRIKELEEKNRNLPNSDIYISQKIENLKKQLKDKEKEANQERDKIEQLRKRIADLEKKNNRTPSEEQELKNEKQKLAQLEKQENSSNLKKYLP